MLPFLYLTMGAFVISPTLQLQESTFNSGKSTCADRSASGHFALLVPNVESTCFAHSYSSFGSA